MAALLSLSHLGIRASVSLFFIILISFVAAALNRLKFKIYAQKYSPHDLKIMVVSTLIPSSAVAYKFINCSVISPILLDGDLVRHLVLTSYLTSGTLKELNNGVHRSVVDGWASQLNLYPSGSHHFTAAISGIFNLEFFESYVILQPICVSLTAIAIILFIRYYEFDRGIEWLTLTLLLLSYFNYSAGWGNHLPLAAAVWVGLAATLFGVILMRERFDYKIFILLFIFLAGVNSSYSYYFLLMILPALVIFVCHLRLMGVLKIASIIILSLSLLLFFVKDLAILIERPLNYWLLGPPRYLLHEWGILSIGSPVGSPHLRIVDDAYTLNIHTISGIPYEQTGRFASYLSTRMYISSLDLWDFASIIMGVLLVTFIIAGIINSRKKRTLILAFGIFFIIWFYLHVLLIETYLSFRIAVLFGPFAILFFSIGFVSVYRYLQEADFSRHLKSKREKRMSMVFLAVIVTVALVPLSVIFYNFMDFMIDLGKIDLAQIAYFLLLFIPISIIIYSLFSMLLKISRTSASFNLNYEMNVRRIFGCILSLIILASLIGLYSGIALNRTNSITENEIGAGQAVEKLVPQGKKLLVLKGDVGGLAHETVVGLFINHEPSGMLAISPIHISSISGGFERLPSWQTNSSFNDFRPEDLYDSSIYTPDAEYILTPRLDEENEEFKNYELVWNNSKYRLLKRSQSTATVSIIPEDPDLINIAFGDSQRPGKVEINNISYDLLFKPETLAIFYEWWGTEENMSITYTNGSRVVKEFDLRYPLAIILPIDEVREVSVHNGDFGISKLGFSAEELDYMIIKRLTPSEVLADIYLEYDEDEFRTNCTFSAYTESRVNLFVINLSSRDVIAEVPLNASQETNGFIEIEGIHKYDLILWFGDESNRTRTILPVFTDDKNNTYSLRERMRIDRDPRILFP